jgi:UPF0271 protein
MGEGFGPWKMGNDTELMKYVSSVSVACGFHAGDPSVMRATVEGAIKAGVAVGAHPSYPDLLGFGRREMKLTPNEIFDITVYQVSALKGICESLGTRLAHVKPHGALYNVASRDRLVATAIVDAVLAIDPDLALFGLAGGELTATASLRGLRAVEEGFADRSYESDGSLTPRSEAGAVFTNPEEAAEQSLRMVMGKVVRSREGKDLTLALDTICIHGDGENAVEIAKSVRGRLEDRGVVVKPASGT